jgi:hypothetical protein
MEKKSMNPDELKLVVGMPPASNDIYNSWHSETLTGTICKNEDDQIFYSQFKQNPLYSCYLVHESSGDVVALSGTALLDDHIGNVTTACGIAFSADSKVSTEVKNMMTLHLSSVSNAKKHAIENKDHTYYHNAGLLVAESYRGYRLTNHQSIGEYMFNEKLKFLSNVTDDKYILYTNSNNRGSQRIFDKKMISCMIDSYADYNINHEGSFISYYIIV